MQIAGGVDAFPQNHASNPDDVLVSCFDAEEPKPIPVVTRLRAPCRDGDGGMVRGGGERSCEFARSLPPELDIRGGSSVLKTAHNGHLR